MKMQEMMMFNGAAKDFEAYSAMIHKKELIIKAINKISNEIQDEEDAISIFEGELSEKDEKRFKEHVTRRKALVTKRSKKYNELELITKRISDLQS